MSQDNLPTSDKEAQHPTSTAINRTSQDSSSNQKSEMPVDASPTGGPKGPPGAEPPDHEYPPTRTVLLLVGALFMAAFLVALVRALTLKTAKQKLTMAGPNNHCNGHPGHHRPLQFPG
jgi:hypothetical protein